MNRRPAWREVVAHGARDAAHEQAALGADRARRRHRHHVDRRHDVAHPRLRQSLRDSIEELGPNTIFLSKLSGVSIAGGAEFAEIMRRPNLTVDDAKAIEKLAPSVGHRRHLVGEGSEIRRSGCSTAASARPQADPRRDRTVRRDQLREAAASAASSPSRRCSIAAAWSCSATRPIRRCSARRPDRSDRQEGAHRRDRIHGHRRDRQEAVPRRPRSGQDDFVVIP